MKISIVCSVYNKSQFIERALLSSLKQSCSDIEMIAVDDGSTDNSLDVIQNLATTFPKLIIIKQKNAGLCGARNSGLDAATGEYVFFHDTDDIMEPEAIAKVVSIAKNMVQIVRVAFSKDILAKSRSKLNVFAAMIWQFLSRTILKKQQNIPSVSLVDLQAIALSECKLFLFGYFRQTSNVYE